MSVVSELEKITQKITEKSKLTRTAYLENIENAKVAGRTRNGLSCGNLAHGMATCSTQDKRLIAGESAANLGIINAYNDMLSAHLPYQDYPELIKKVAKSKGVTAQVAGGVPAMCDGVTQGQAGMELSLFSRDLIAMSTAVSLSHNMFDGVLCLGVCDKIVPGLLIGALRFGHLPTIFLPAGPMSTGQSNSEKSKVRQLYAEGKVGRAELLESESRSYHGAGTCTFYGTANSNQMLMEIMGLHLPGSSFVPPYTELREKLTQSAVETLIGLCDNQAHSICLADIVSERTIVNGIVGLLATGGSTNHAIHLVAIAKAAGILIDWQDMAELSNIVPLLCRIYPNGSADINHFHAAGGMTFLMKQLRENGLLHEQVKTVLGDGLAEYCKEPKLVSNNSAELFREKQDVKLTSSKVIWNSVDNISQDPEVLQTVEQAFSKRGGLQLLSGNLGRAVIKVSAVALEHQIVEAPALVFDSQDALEQAFKEGQLERDFVAVIRYQGPKTNGMPELHKLTPMLIVLLNRGFKVALVTDGRMSGASGKVPAAIHLVPEACEGGPISKVRNGDVIRLDAIEGTLEIAVCEEELKARETIKSSVSSTEFGMGRELFSNFRQYVGDAENGATVFDLECYVSDSNACQGVLE